MVLANFVKFRIAAVFHKIERRKRRRAKASESASLRKLEVDSDEAPVVQWIK